jgi:predicted pyridoxine 5'-phosphate oxidase superfamily flavin-nucleotide-binding protein
MIKLTDEMRQLINRARANETPCIMATASPDGVPNAGFRGTMMVLDEESLAYRERGQPSTVQQLEDNPKVVVLFRHPGRNVGWKFRCTASVYRDGPVFQRVMDALVAEELLSNDDGRGTAVVLRVDQILTLYGEILQERVPNLSW